MKLLGALSIPRDKILELKYEGFKHLVRGVLTAAKWRRDAKQESMSMIDSPNARNGMNTYLLSQGIYPNDKSIMLWLQENNGPFVGIFILEINDKVDFLITTGTQAELKEIGKPNVKE